MLFIDADNGMGSRFGDVDDAFAITALVRSGLPIAAISSASGNTSEPAAARNNARLTRLLGWNGPLLRAVDAAKALGSFTGRVAALAPLTNVTSAVNAKEMVVVGGTLATRGRWPPLWPHEFNLTKDRAATLSVFRSEIPLTIFPLDVARQLFVTVRELEQLPGEAGAFLCSGARRWMWRLRLLKATGRFPIYDLAAALYLISTEGLAMEDTRASIDDNTFIHFGTGPRHVRVCVALDRDLLWERFRRLLF